MGIVTTRLEVTHFPPGFVLPPPSGDPDAFWLPKAFGPDGSRGTVHFGPDGSMFAGPRMPVPDPATGQGQLVELLPKALIARNAIFGNYDSGCIDEFVSGQLCMPVGERWREAASTALLTDWEAPLRRGGVITAEKFFSTMRAEIRTAHRQLVPLWRRRVNRRRVLLLDTPMGDGVSLNDLLVDRAQALELGGGFQPTDARLAALLRVMRPEERAVLVAWTDPGVTTWTDAALCAGASDPGAFGERVRRKARRWIAEQERRRLQTHTPGQECGPEAAGVR